MRIDSAFIDGYGVFSGQSMDGLADGGVVLFTGSNEAGKSTLRHFFIDMLFGARRRSAPPHPPLRGGAHGGLLHIIMQDGDERSVERSFSGPGRYGACAEVGGMSRELYSNVFAFGLPELVTFEGLTGEEAASRIFSAGAGLGASSYARAKQQLGSAMDSLGTRSSRNRPLNVACDRLSEALERLERIKRQQGRYSELTRDIEAMQLERDRLARLAAQLEADITRLGQLNRTRELWESMETARRELERLKAARVPGYDSILALAGRIDALGPALERWLAQMHEATQVQVRLGSASARARDSMLRLGPAWNEARVEAFDTSIEARQLVRDYGERIADADARLRVAQANVEAALRAVQECTRARGDVVAERERHRPESLPDEAVARGRLAAASAARSALADLNAASARLEADLGRLDGATQAAEWAAAARRQAAGMGGLREKLASAFPFMVAVAAAVAALAVLAEGSSAAGAGGATATALLLAAVAAGAGTVAIAQRKTRAGRLNAAIAAEREAASRMQAAAHARATSSEAVAAARRALDDCLAQLAKMGAPLPSGQTAAADALQAALPSALDAIEEQAREHLAVLREIAGLNTRLKRADDSLDEARGELERRRQELSEAGRTRERAARDWAAWLSRAGMPESTRPDFVLDVFDAVNAVRTSLAEARSASEMLARLKVEIQGFTDEVASVCEALGHDASAAAAEAAAAATATATTAPPSSDTLAAAVATATTARVPQLVATLADELRKARAAREQLEKAESRFASLSTGFAASYPEATLAEALASHGATTAEQICVELATAERELAAVRESMERLAGEYALLVQEKERMEGADAQLVAEIDVESARQELAAVVRNWAVLAVARRLMDAAVESYETQRQPAVMREASETLHLITGGRWARIVARVAELATIDVEDARGARRSTEELSYGTQQQLYLAVRCGLVREYAKRGEPLPVILDDVLVNFDPERAAATAVALSDLSDSCQVLVFTCHPEMAQAFIRAGKVSAHFELADGQINRL